MTSANQEEGVVSPPADDSVDHCPNPPLVSVIVPTYNRAHLLGRAIDSLLRQDHERWEAIIVDDGSQDGTAELLATYHDPRIRVITHEVNKGILSARNTGLEAVSGAWFTFLSSDDELLPHALFTMLSIPLELDPTINTVMCHSLDTSTGGNAGTGPYAGYLDSESLAQGECWFLIRTDVLSGDRFIEGLNTFESEWWLRVLPRMKRYFIDESLYVYHTEAEDRVTLSYEKGTAAMSYYQQWTTVFDENPDYLVQRHRAGLGNPFPAVISLFRDHNDLERASRAVEMARREGLAIAEQTVLPPFSKPSTQWVRQLVVRTLRALRLKPPPLDLEHESK